MGPWPQLSARDADRNPSRRGDGTGAEASGRWNGFIGRVLLVAGFIWAAWLDPWSLSGTRSRRPTESSGAASTPVSPTTSNPELTLRWTSALWDKLADDGSVLLVIRPDLKGGGMRSSSVWTGWRSRGELTQAHKLLHDGPMQCKNRTASAGS